jgi:hypothetical protein
MKIPPKKSPPKKSPPKNPSLLASNNTQRWTVHRWVLLGETIESITKFPSLQVPFYRLEFAQAFQDIRYFLDEEWRKLASIDVWAYLTSLDVEFPDRTEQQLVEVLGWLEPEAYDFKKVFVGLLAVHARYGEIKSYIEDGELISLQQIIARLDLTLHAARVHENMEELMTKAQKGLEDEQSRL